MFRSLFVPRFVIGCDVFRFPSIQIKSPPESLIESAWGLVRCILNAMLYFRKQQVFEIQNTDPRLDSCDPRRGRGREIQREEERYLRQLRYNRVDAKNKDSKDSNLASIVL